MQVSTITIQEFLTQFPTLTSTTPPEDLSDGVALFEALAEISLEHFDPTSISRDLGENWALKLTNLRKLVRNLELFYQEELGKGLDLKDVDLNLIAKEGSEVEIGKLFGFIAAAAVQCEDRGVYVGRIMNMSTASQMEMKEVIESALMKLEDTIIDDYDGVNSRGGAENEISFEHEESDDDSYMGGAGETQLLRAQLQEAQVEIEELKKSQSEMNYNNAEELQAANEKLKLFADDLQDRLQDRETELTEAEEQLGKSKRSVDELSTQVEYLSESNKLLEDEMNVAQSQVLQLRKAEANVLTYRKRLEDAALSNQQVQELEDQSASYLRQIMDLENSVKTIPSLQRKITELTNKLQTLVKDNEESVGSVETVNAELMRLKRELDNSENSKKVLEDELVRVKHELEEASSSVPESEGNLSANKIVQRDYGLGSIGVTSQNLAEMREKVVRLEHENKALKDQISATDGGTIEGNVSSAELIACKATIKALEADVAERETLVNKLSSDKEKLEAYTKKTLHKFQEKYLVALQECKAKLRDKHDKIEALESRQAAERSAQKREERLLSGVMYELGLAIMQNRLTNK